MKTGNLMMMLGAMFANFRPEVRTTDPELSSLTNVQEAVFWYNSTEKKYKYFDGTAIHVFGGDGGTTGDFLPLAGGTLTGPLLLDTDELSPEADGKTAVPLAHVAAALSNKMDKLSGLGTAAAVVTDEEGKLGVSNVTATELGYVSGVTSSIQEQLDAKMPSGDLVLTTDLNAQQHQITNLSAPVSPLSAMRKADVTDLMLHIPVKQSVKAIQTDASLVPEKVDGARYLITDKDQLNPAFGTLTGLENNVVLEYSTAQATFLVDWEPDPEFTGTMFWVDSISNYVEYNGTKFEPRIKGQAPQSGSGTTVKAGGVVDVNVADPIHIDGNNVTLNIGAEFEVDSVSRALKLKTGAVPIGAIDPLGFGDGLEIKEGKLVANIPDTSGFIQDNGSVTQLTVTGVPTEDGHIVNKKYFDENKGDAGTYKRFVYTSSEDKKTHVIQHNLNESICHVTVFIGAEIVQPSSILINANDATVTFTEDTSCTVLITA